MIVIPSGPATSGTVYHSLDALAPWVRPHVPGVPEIALAKEIRDSAIEFCARSRVWQAFLDSAPCVANQTQYLWPLDPGSNVAVILECWWKGRQLKPIAADELAFRQRNWPWRSGQPECYYQLDQNSVSLYPIPSEEGCLTARAALKPALNAESLPQILFDSYAEVVAFGAIARLLLTQMKPWSNPELGAAFLEKYESGIAAASVDAAKSFTRAKIRAVGRYF